MKPGIRPVGNKVLVEKAPIEKYSKGGILLALDERQEMAARQIGELVAVSELAWKDWGTGNPWAKEGDIVYFVKYAGREVYDNKTEKEYYLLNDVDIVGVVENE